MLFGLIEVAVLAYQKISKLPELYHLKKKSVGKPEAGLLATQIKL